MIGISKVLCAPRDGHTIGRISSNFSVSSHPYKLPFEPLRNLRPMSIVSSGANVLMVNRELGERMAARKQEPMAARNTRAH